MSGDLGTTRLASYDERAQLKAVVDGPLVPTGPEALLEALRKELGAEYELQSELGRGGMAVVYKAVERDLFRTVALKVLPRGLGGPTVAERFRREARMAAALDHPNIIPVYRVGQAAGTFFLAMRFVEGRSVEAILASQGALEIPAAVLVLREAAAALAFAHQRGIVHRDVKGANILVDGAGKVWVSDFGIAKAIDDNSLTAGGVVMGTPPFMSPEQGAGRKVGPQGDQYSLGVLAFQLLAGAVPFQGKNMLETLQHHFHTPLPDLGRVRGDIPAALRAVIERALAKAPAARYPSTGDLASALYALPLSEEDLKAGEDQLRQLAAGKQVPKVNVGVLPPLPDLSGRTSRPYQANL